ncbi:class II fumarate hydratase [Liquorilactobacillus satsumensis]|uniref:class II fumarate hydratase n=1 Tax=Liquorilactobacillus satsumensis TaxID=259059 RepID=UPI001E3F405E|nr:class II fumarate hydratase [Liquorilactobacillus satsumensis]MCC7666128.1 class II fumarate hydratase [Liquorilactobacillus satsumensis]MCP9329312.1 class II fumarate hydratase [Liquorilactobacillus satsumensis]MCP9357395.1 class II fumarate hydratase [Liquorilactobacillus satsumensis]MCP9371223.1 class II fumarate hydratase [Liquorilactobacillus satsumensis]
MTSFRIEEDTLGPVKIPADALWGPQTERSRHNFKTGKKIPLALIRVLIELKKAAAQANGALGQLTSDKTDIMVAAADKLLGLTDEKLERDFPLHIYQTGSGTQTNMNVNEVIANLAARMDNTITIRPNDEVNHGQSSNDIFPTAMNITAYLELAQLIAGLEHLIAELDEKRKKYWRTVKIGRTHLQDATPLTFGQEVSGWVSMLQHDLQFIQALRPSLLELPLGGTAVGTGMNAAPGFAAAVATRINTRYHSDFTVKSNKFYGLSAHSALNAVHGALKTLASDLLKIANDVRFLASGPRAGYGELHIPANEPGSSIMPGKINPTQAEALTMAALRVMGNDTVITTAASQGNFEMNVFKPLIIETFLESVEVLEGTMNGFADKMIHGLTVNEKRMSELVADSLMTVTALSPHIGYHASAKIAQQAEKEGTTLKEAALKSGKVTAEQFDLWVDPLKMTNSEGQ